MNLSPQDFRGQAEKIDDLDIPRIGSVIGVGEDEVHALLEVEAGSAGFDAEGRPKMLFEPHVFYRNLPKETRDRAVSLKLAYKSWRSGEYPADSYPRLKRAMELDPEAALKAASWGRSQILGENYAICGYYSVFDMVQAFMDDEARHLEAMIEFIVSNNIDGDLRAHRWEAVARVYNGPGYAEHNYHGRLRESYKKWSQVKDTKWNPDGKTILYPDLRRGHSGFVVEHLQTLLHEKGYPTGNIDGAFGSATTAAVLSFQEDQNLGITGDVNQATWSKLMGIGAISPLVEARSDETVSDLREKGSSTIKTADAAQAGGVLVTLAGVAGFAIDVLGPHILPGYAERATEIVEPFSDMVGANWTPLLTAVGIGVLYAMDRIKKIRLKDHKLGKNRGR